MAKGYETIQVFEIRPKTAKSYRYHAEGKAGYPPDVIWPMNFHPAVSLRMPRGTAAAVRAGDYTIIEQLRHVAMEAGAMGKVQFRIALGGIGRGGAQVRAKVATGKPTGGFRVIVKEMELG